MDLLAAAANEKDEAQKFFRRFLDLTPINCEIELDL